MTRRRRFFAPGPQAGVTLVEVLAAIFVMGVGLLALLTLFPLGALEMAQAVKDDRTAAIADDAEAFGEAGRQLLLETAGFVEVSLANGSADPQTALRLREGYEELAVQAEELEVKIDQLRDQLEPEEIQRYAAPLRAELRAIRRRIYPVTRLLLLVESAPR